MAVWVNGEFLAYREVTNGTWNYDYTAKTLDAGYYTVRADLVDVAGNIAVSSPLRTIEMDRSGSEFANGTHDPLADQTIAVTAIFEDNGVRNDDFYTSDRTLVFSGTTNAPDGSNVAVWLNGGFLAYVKVAGGTWRYDYTFQSLNDGYYNLQANLVDVAGNIAVASQVKGFAIDNSGSLLPDGTHDPLGDAAIAIASIVSDTGASASDFITSATSVTAYGTGVANAWIQVFLDGKYLGNRQIDGGGNWSYGLSTPQGNHTIKTHYIDLAENVVPGPVAERGMIVDTTAPVFTTPANSNVNENTAAGTMIYDAATSDATAVTYAITGGADAARFSINASTGQVTMNFVPDFEKPVDAGGNNVYDYIITATDVAGNQSTQHASLSIADVYEYKNFVPNGDFSGADTWARKVYGNGYNSDDYGVRGSTNSSNSGGGSRDLNSSGAYHIDKDTSGSLGPSNLLTYTTLSENLVQGKTYRFSYDFKNGAGEDANYSWVLMDSGNNIVYTLSSGTTNSSSWSTKDTSFVMGSGTGSYRLGLTWSTSDTDKDGSTKGVDFDRVYLGLPPVVLDLNHDGLISYNDAAVDVSGNGLTHTAAWVGPQDGVLVWDKYSDGKVHDSSQYAFAQYLAGAKTDLEGLRAFDTNGNGKLDGDDTVWNEMRVWQDLNGDGISDVGELKTLAAWSVTSLHLTSDGVVENPYAGVQESGKSSASLADGRKMVVADVMFDAYTVVGNGEAVAKPFVLDMNHNGLITYDKALIDISGNGHKELVVWAGKGDGVLVWDKYQDGSVRDNTQYSFSSLKVFDTNGDGKLSSSDALWKQLSVWQDANGDGVSEAGEVKTISELGFKEINFVSDGVLTQPAAGVIEYGKASVTMNDGSPMAATQASFSLLDQSQWTQTASAVI